MIEISASISLDDDELDLTFLRAGGPGGQNVNKVATAVQLRFDASGSPSLPEDVKRRLISQAGSKATKDGVIVLTANRFRTQLANRRDAIDRLVAMIQRAEFRPKPRVPTKPSRAQRRKRLEAKNQRSQVKNLRRRPES